MPGLFLVLSSLTQDSSHLGTGWGPTEEGRWVGCAALQEAVGGLLMDSLGDQTLASVKLCSQSYL